MIRTFLTIASTLLLWVFIGPARAQQQEPVLPEKSRPGPIAGLGETEESAKLDAVKTAVKTVQTLMRLHNPPMTSFEPAADYVRQHLLTDDGRAGKEIPVDGFDHPFKEWIVTFRTDYNWWKEIVQLDREQARKNRAEFHQALTFRAVMALSGVLLAGFGYVRLNEYTRKRYTTLLRVAGLGVASLFAAGLWLTFQG